MWLFRKGQKQRLKWIWIETLRHSYQNTFLLLCPVTHSSKGLLAFTCLTSDSLPVSASTPLQFSLCCNPRSKFPSCKSRPDLTWAVLLRQSCTFSQDSIQGRVATPLLQFAAQSQTSAQSRLACSLYSAHGSLYSHTRRVWIHSKGKVLATPSPFPGARATHTPLCRSQMSERRWGTASTSPITHFLVTSPADLAVFSLCLFCRWWADPFSRRVKEWHQELG